MWLADEVIRIASGFPVRIKNSGGAGVASLPLHLRLRKEPSGAVRTAGRTSYAAMTAT
jgi:hypothetical protein